MARLVWILALALLASGCATATVYGVVGDEDDLYTGSAIGYMTRSGTIELRNSQGNSCKGDFAYYRGVLAGHGIIGCDDGQRATIRFIGLSPLSGYGRGTSSTGRPVAFTYGMSREQSVLYLGLRPTTAQR
jgi:hypothetical protein